MGSEGRRGSEGSIPNPYRYWHPTQFSSLQFFANRRIGRSRFQAKCRRPGNTGIRTIVSYHDRNLGPALIDRPLG